MIFFLKQRSRGIAAVKHNGEADQSFAGSSSECKHRARTEKIGMRADFRRDALKMLDSCSPGAVNNT